VARHGDNSKEQFGPEKIGPLCACSICVQQQRNEGRLDGSVSGSRCVGRSAPHQATAPPLSTHAPRAAENSAASMPSLISRAEFYPPAAHAAASCGCPSPPVPRAAHPNGRTAGPTACRCHDRYELVWCIVGAFQVGAPHIRDTLPPIATLITSSSTFHYTDHRSPWPVPVHCAI
jgi:hypothetical protein